MPERDPVGRDVAGAGDAELLARVARSDREALTELYRRHSAAVFLLAHLLLGRSRAQETTQEVFLYLWDHADELRADERPLRSALLQRVRLLHPAGDPGEADGDSEPSVAALTADERAALELALDGASYGEAPARLRRSSKEVNELLRSALLKLYEGTDAPKDPRPP